jgi:hypothetical protein
MSDLLGIPQIQDITGISRQRIWLMYKAGKLQPVMIVGTPLRPRPLFSRTYIEKYFNLTPDKVA